MTRSKWHHGEGTDPFEELIFSAKVLPPPFRALAYRVLKSEEKAIDKNGNKNEVIQRPPSACSREPGWLQHEHVISTVHYVQQIKHLLATLLRQTVDLIYSTNGWRTMRIFIKWCLLFKIDERISKTAGVFQTEQGRVHVALFLKSFHGRISWEIPGLNCKVSFKRKIRENVTSIAMCFDFSFCNFTRTSLHTTYVQQDKRESLKAKTVTKR